MTKGLKMKKILLIFVLSHSYTYGFHSIISKTLRSSVPTVRLLSTKTSAYDPVYTTLMLTAIASAPLSIGSILHSIMDKNKEYELTEKDWQIIRIISIANS